MGVGRQQNADHPPVGVMADPYSRHTGTFATLYFCYYPDQWSIKVPESLCRGRTGLEEPVLGQVRYPALPVYGGAAQKAGNLSSLTMSHSKTVSGLLARDHQIPALHGDT